MLCLAEESNQLLIKETDKVLYKQGNLHPAMCGALEFSNLGYQNTSAIWSLN